MYNMTIVEDQGVLQNVALPLHQSKQDSATFTSFAPPFLVEAMGSIAKKP
jgi:hypothetical protein